jgi:membrane fusion protein (multidrug efflux system)
MKASSIAAGIAVFVVLGAAGGGLAFYKYRGIMQAAAQQGGFEPPESIEVVAVRSVDWNPSADLVGTVFSLRSVALKNELAGRVSEVHFDSGSVVEPGQVLLVLDDTLDRADLGAAQAAVRVAEASVASAEVRAALAASELKRIETAARESAVTDMELDRKRSERDQTQAELVRAKAEVDQARSKVAQVEARLSKLVVRSPFRARAGIRSVHEGQYLGEGTAVANLEEVADRIYLDFAIPQDYLVRVKAGTKVMATSPLLGAGPVPIEVVAVDAAVNNETRNVRVRSIVDNADDRLRPGMFIQIRVPVESPKPCTVVPATAVRRTPYGDQVYVVGPGESPDKMRAKQRFVKLGPSIGEDVVILDGLKPGEQIAAGGSFKLRDGALVVIMPPKAAPSEAAAKAEQSVARE